MHLHLLYFGCQCLYFVFHQYFYTKAAVGCAQWNNPKDCQILANLCVLYLYDENEPPCELYRALVKGTKNARKELTYPKFYPDKGFK